MHRLPFLTKWARMPRAPRRAGLVLACLAWGLWYAGPALATTYHVANSACSHGSAPCSDSNDGLSRATALCTLQAALNKLAPGSSDTIEVHTGTYVDDAEFPNWGGKGGASPQAPITITGAPGDPLSGIILRGTASQNSDSSTQTSANTAVIRINGVSSSSRIKNIRIKDLTINPGNRRGIFTFDSSYIEVDNCVFENWQGSPSNTQGSAALVAKDSDHVTFKNSTISNHGVQQTGVGALEFGRVRHATVYNNTIRDVEGGCIHGSSSDNDKGHVFVIQNHFANCQGVNDETATFQVYNNSDYMFYGNLIEVPSNGKNEIWSIRRTSGGEVSAHIVGNTILNSATGVTAIRVWGGTGGGPDGVTIRNNLFLGFDNDKASNKIISVEALLSCNGYDEDYNYIYRTTNRDLNDGTSCGLTWGPHTTRTDTASPDLDANYVPNVGSPVIDAGDPTLGYPAATTSPKDIGVFDQGETGTFPQVFAIKATTTTSTPTIRWGGTPNPGDIVITPRSRPPITQSYYRVQIDTTPSFDSQGIWTPLADSGLVAGSATTWTVPSLPDGNYYVRLTRAGSAHPYEQEWSDPYYRFTVASSGGGDQAPPTGVGNVSPADGATGVATSPILTAATASDATPPVSYYFELYQGGACSGTPVRTRAYGTSTTWNPTGLTAGTTYAWRNKARDNVNPPNESGFGACWTFTTADSTPDTTPPVVSNVTATNITSSSAMITWTTDEPADSYVEYGTTTSYGSVASDAAMVTSHSVPLSRLTADTLYHYHVRSTDGSGNSSAFSQDQTFTTSPAPSSSIEGFGAGAQGGSTPCSVTSLADSGPGTLRDCLSASGRNITFSVGGTITPLSRYSIPSFTTIDGSTAPAPGITIDGSKIPSDSDVFRIYADVGKVTSDIIVRHIRVANVVNSNNDGLSLWGVNGTSPGLVQRVAIDHVSIRDATDGNIDIAGNVQDVTVQWSIFGYTPGATSRGHNFTNLLANSPGPQNITMHHNLYVRGDERNPQADLTSILDFRNNVVRHWTNYGARFRNGTTANFVNNDYYTKNTSVGNKALIVVPLNESSSVPDSGPIYVNGNLIPQQPGADQLGLAPQPYSAPPVSTDSASGLEAIVLASVGPQFRDSGDDELIAASRYYTSSSSDTTPPSGVGNVSPPDGATGVSQNPTLVAATASDSTGPVSYYFELFSGSLCSGTPLQTRAYATSTDWTPATLASGATFAWRNKARDAVSPPNESAFGPCWTFTTGTSSGGGQANCAVFVTDVTSGPVGTYVTLYGRGFSTSGTVSFNGTAAVNYPVWTDSKVVVQVPDGATSGSLSLDTAACSSDGGSFTVRSGNIYFVDGTAGNDANAGTQSQPWKTLAKASASVASGDVVIIRSGTYAESNSGYGLKMATSGTASRPVVFRGFPGETVTITVGGTSPSDTVRISGDYNILSGVRVSDSAKQAISMAGNYGTVFDCEVLRSHLTTTYGSTGSAINIGLGTTGNSVYASDIHDNGSVASQDHGFYVKGDNVDIAWNDVHDNFAYGIQLYHGGGSTHTGAVIRNNSFHNNGRSGILVSKGSVDTSVYNNIVYSNADAGIQVNYSPVTTVSIFNNTSYGNGGWQYDVQSGSGIELKNNIASPTNGNALRVTSGASNVTSDFNLFGPAPVSYSWMGTTYSSLAALQNASGQDASSLEDDPLFMSPGAADFRVQDGSPAIDGGTMAGAPSTDRIAVARPQGAAVDIGAYEKAGAGGPPGLPGTVQNAIRTDKKR